MKKAVKQGKSIRILAEMIKAKGYENPTQFFVKSKKDGLKICSASTTLHTWLRGDFAPRKNTLVKLKEALKCTPKEATQLDKWRDALNRAIENNKGKKKTRRVVTKKKNTETIFGVITEVDIAECILPIIRRRGGLSVEEYKSLNHLAFSK